MANSTSDDLQAYYASVPYGLSKDSIRMLRGGLRFDQESNKVYRIPSDMFDEKNIADEVNRFLQHHYTHQLTRITTLQRYYEGDNDIHYWKSDKSKNRADNRIASGHPRYITTMRVGYSLGKGIKFVYNTPDNKPASTQETKLMAILDKFNQLANESYVEKTIKKDLSITGRAYELLYVGKDQDEKPQAKITVLDPANAFVVYDTSVEQHSLFAVYYYLVRYNDQSYYYITAYTDKQIYHFRPVTSIGEKLIVDSKEEHYFSRVPVTEYANNDERLGDWEADLDLIDAYDKVISEMANSEEDFSNATLVVNGDIDVPKTVQRVVRDSDGNPVLDEDGNPVTEIDPNSPYLNTLSRVMYLKPSIINNANGGVTVVPSSASYLTKELPIDNWKTHIDQIVRDIYTDTNTPNINDESFGGNSSGVAMAYKLFGSDQVRENQNDLFIRGLMRRLRLLAHFWNIRSLISDETLVNNITPKFTPNLPKNDADLVANMVAMANSGVVSKETLRNYIEPTTGVKEPEETRRMDEQIQKDPDRIDPNRFNNHLAPDAEEGDNDDQGTDEAK